jgi:hypothetical protein
VKNVVCRTALATASYFVFKSVFGVEFGFDSGFAGVLAAV